MVTIQETDLKEGILLAVERANTLGRPVLVSEVHKIEAIEPLSFFHTGKERYLGERFFWKDPSDETFIIGIGIAKQIQSDQDTDRFFHVGKEWKCFIDEAIIYNRNTVMGVGPLMFGGFSFDPYKHKTTLWSKFAHSLFHIPKYMLSIISGQAYLTTNVLCTRHDDSTLFQKVIDERNRLLLSAQTPQQVAEVRLANTVEIAPDEWKRSVSEVVEDLKSGPLKKVVLARELKLHFEGKVDPETVLAHLLREQHESFIFALEANGDCFLGASPERLVKKRGDQVFSTCL
ncbi:MAG: chorismate-binding protein, partial [Bacillota bacterium]|nr:chorismate-binding protein [Bacillota bacterium]